jgi:hypothetical protein
MTDGDVGRGAWARIRRRTARQALGLLGPSTAASDAASVTPGGQPGTPDRSVETGFTDRVVGLEARLERLEASAQGADA